MSDTQVYAKTFRPDEIFRSRANDGGTTVSVVIIDPVPISSLGIKYALSKLQGIDIVAEMNDFGAQMQVSRIKSLKPDMLIVSAKLLTEQGIATLQSLRRLLSEPRVVVCSIETGVWQLLRFLKLNANAYISAMATPEVIEAAIRFCAESKSFMDPVLLEALVDNLSTFEYSHLVPNANLIIKLSTRERDIFDQVANGKATEEIARNLRVSMKTVQNHKLNIVSKLSLKSSKELESYAKKVVSRKFF